MFVKGATGGDWKGQPPRPYSLLPVVRTRQPERPHLPRPSHVLRIRGPRLQLPQGLDEYKHKPKM